ncbi:MAG: glutamate racemase [Verrucomicrobiota bacterium]
MKPDSQLPIGVFDSGIGGLTVVRELHRVLPNEDIIYLGDTARVPYGTKSPDTVTRFACEDAQFLIQQKVKALVVACNTASAWALPALQQRFSLPIFGVILPGARVALEKTRNRRIGVIGTASTVRSKAYTNAIRTRDEGAKVFSEACPLLVPLVEEGLLDHAATRIILEEYLRPLLRKQIDTLILGCTHYPLLKKAIGKITKRNVALVDSAECCAASVAESLAQFKLLTPQNTRKGTLRPYVTDDTERFEAMAERFLGFPTEQTWKVELPALKE